MKLGNCKFPKKQTVYKFLRLLLIGFFIFGGSAFIVKNLTPPDYTIRFKRECDGIKCEKIKVIDSGRSTSIENDIERLSSNLERFDFFARFTFLRFDLQTTNRSQFIFAVTEPKYEEGFDIMMQCGLNGKEYIFSPNSGIIFSTRSSIRDIVQELGNVQNILINCNPAPQKIEMISTKFVAVAPNAYVQFIYNEEKYHLRFLSDKWNYPLTVLEMFIIVGIFLGAFYDIKNFVRGSSEV